MNWIQPALEANCIVVLSSVLFCISDVAFFSLFCGATAIGNVLQINDGDGVAENLLLGLWVINYKFSFLSPFIYSCSFISSIIYRHFSCDLSVKSKKNKIYFSSGFLYF